VLTTDYKLMVESSAFNNFQYKDDVIVDGVAYQVREPVLLDDGKITEVMLMKV